jgi:glucose-6-phosphate dehydrogenase assembly protein OpcA
MTVQTTVDIGAIERELRQLWTDNAAEADGQAVTRALTLSLVARATDGDTAERISQIVQELTASHPNRAVLVSVRPDAEPRLEAFVQANCLLGNRGAPQVCGEQITIDARGPAASQVASLVLPLLVPDLPVVLWLPGPRPFDDPLLARLRVVLDRLIVDSRSFAEPTRELAQMAAFDAAVRESGGSRPNRPALSDLGWAELTPWRELTAQFFDTRVLLPHLRRVDRLEIDYVREGQGTNHVQGLLMAGWLASCLGWTPLEEAVSVEGGTLRLHLRRPAVNVGPSAIRLITVELRALAADAGPPGLHALHLRALDGVQADFSVERSAEEGVALTTAQVSGMAPVRRLARCERQSDGSLLTTELRLLSRDRIFGNTLRVAGAFASKLP